MTKEKEITVTEMSNRTGALKRQIMYMIRTDKIEARKEGWIWLIPESEEATIKSIIKR